MINSNNHDGPLRVIVVTATIKHRFLDNEPYAQKITLSCEHWAYNTFGLHHTEFKVGDKIKCLRCKND